MKLRLQVSDHF